MTRAPSHDSQKPAPPPSNPPPAFNPPVRPVDIDEFGEDFDLSAEDLNELMDGQPPLHQRPLHQIPPHPNPPPAQAFESSNQNQSDLTAPGLGEADQPILVNDYEDDDEFACDDIDEATLVQAEFSATQAFRASHSQPHVSSSKNR